jgi:hypothetical protein
VSISGLDAMLDDVADKDAAKEETRGRQAERGTGTQRRRRHASPGPYSKGFEAIRAELKKLHPNHKEGCIGFQKINGVLKRCGCFEEEEKKINKREEAEDKDGYTFVEAEQDDNDMGVEALDEGQEKDEDWDMLGELYPKTTSADDGMHAHRPRVRGLQLRATTRMPF